MAEPNTSSKVKLGALWKKQISGNREILSGVVTVDGKEVRVTVFPNGYKNSDRHPDYIIYLDDWKERQAASEFPEQESAPVDEDDVELPF